MRAHPIRDTRLLHSGLALLAFTIQALPASGGRPIPYEYPDQFRQANMVMLQFQDALGKERWEEALSHCTERVQTGAKRSPDIKKFFTTTLPFDRVVANFRFGFWHEGHGNNSHDYGMLIDMTPPGSDPHVQWFWSISSIDAGPWLIDWEPVEFDLAALSESKKKEEAERQAKISKILQEMEPTLRGVKTHVQPISKEFVIGSPMLFQIELSNFAKTPLNYTAAGVGYFPLRVLNEKRVEIPCIPGIAQIMVRRGQLAPGETKVLAEKVDLNKDYSFTKPGTYYVQYDGASLNIGEWMATERVHDPEFVQTSTTFPTNIVKIEIKGKTGE